MFCYLFRNSIQKNLGGLISTHNNTDMEPRDSQLNTTLSKMNMHEPIHVYRPTFLQNPQGSWKKMLDYQKSKG